MYETVCTDRGVRDEIGCRGEFQSVGPALGWSPLSTIACELAVCGMAGVSERAVRVPDRRDARCSQQDSVDRGPETDTTTGDLIGTTQTLRTRGWGQRKHRASRSLLPGGQQCLHFWQPQTPLVWRVVPVVVQQIRSTAKSWLDKFWSNQDVHHCLLDQWCSKTFWGRLLISHGRGLHSTYQWTSLFAYMTIKQISMAQVIIVFVYK